FAGSRLQSADADAAGNDKRRVQRFPVEALDGLADLLADLDRARGGGLREAEQELVAAIARDDIDAAALALEYPRDDTQHVVREHVGEGVVDVLELVDVEHRDGDGMAEALRATEL